MTNNLSNSFPIEPGLLHKKKVRYIKIPNAHSMMINIFCLLEKECKICPFNRTLKNIRKLKKNELKKTHN